MSNTHFSNLDTKEQEMLYMAPALVTVLISGADDLFEKNEEKRAERAIHFRQSIGDELLFEYFAKVETTFEQDIDLLMANYKDLNHEDRNKQISNELEKLNDILTKVDEKVAHAIVKNLKSLAAGISNVSGSILGVSANVAKSEWVKLPMIRL
jgi:hypothetical protein